MSNQIGYVRTGYLLVSELIYSVSETKTVDVSNR